MTLEMYKNTLVSVEEAQLYFEERFDSSKWFELTEEDKEKLLISASKKISYFDYVGKKADPAQPLAFPRDFEMPSDIKDAVCEEAIMTAEKCGTVHASNQKLGIKSVSLGAGSISYDNGPAGEEGNVLISPEAIYLIKRWLQKGFMF